MTIGFTARQYLQKLMNIGFTFGIDGDNYTISPKKDVTPETWATLKAYGNQVIEAIRTWDQDTIAELEARLSFLREKWQACIEYQKEPEYRTFSKSVKDAEKEAFARMEEEGKALRAKLDELKKNVQARAASESA